MIALQQTSKVYERLSSGAGVDDSTAVLLKTLPAAVRRMGLVRTIEWMGAGSQNRAAGERLFSYVGPALGLAPLISDAVKTLEECDRRKLFGAHRDAIALFDQLALLHRAGDRS